MFNLTTTNRSEIKGHIEFRKFPTLGRNTDMNSDIWDVGAIIYGTVCAVPIGELHPYFNDTSGQCFGFISQSWPPYTFEVKHQPEGTKSE